MGVVTLSEQILSVSISKMVLFVIVGEVDVSQTPLRPCQMLVMNCVGFTLLLRAP